MSLEVLISFGVTIIVAVLGYLTSSMIQRRTRKNQIEIRSLESLDEENKVLRKTNYELQLEIIALQRQDNKRELELQILKEEKEDIKEELDNLVAEVFAYREREFQLQSEVGLLRRHLEECQSQILELIKKTS